MTSRPVVTHSHAPFRTSSYPIRSPSTKKSSHMLSQKRRNTPHMLRLFHLLTFIHKQVKGGGGTLWFAKISRQCSSLLRADHLGDEVDDGVGRLVGVQLGEEVADVVGCASLLTRHEPKQPRRSENRNYLSLHYCFSFTLLCSTLVHSLGCASLRFVPSTKFKSGSVLKCLQTQPDLLDCLLKVNLFRFGLHVLTFCPEGQCHRTSQCC